MKIIWGPRRATQIFENQSTSVENNCKSLKINKTYAETKGNPIEFDEQLMHIIEHEWKCIQLQYRK